MIPDHCPEEFLECEVVYENGWSDHEECGWIIVFDFFGELFSWEYNYCVFAEDNDVHFNPCEIDEADLEQLIESWEEE